MTELLWYELTNLFVRKCAGTQVHMFIDGELGIEASGTRDAMVDT